MKKKRIKIFIDKSDQPRDENILMSMKREVNMRPLFFRNKKKYYNRSKEKYDIKKEY